MRSGPRIDHMPHDFGIYISHKSDFSGERIGRLKGTVHLKRVSGTLYWRCRCDCGRMVNVRASQLRKHRSSDTFDCGHSSSFRKSHSDSWLPQAIDASWLQSIPWTETEACLSGHHGGAARHK